MTQISSMEQMTALPDGSQIDVNHRRWTRSAGFWTAASFTMSDAQFLHEVEQGQVRLATGVTVARPAWMQVGYMIDTYEEMRALPVGAILGPNESERYEVVEPGRVRRLDTVYDTSTHSMEHYLSTSFNRILSLPEVPVEQDRCGYSVGERMTMRRGDPARLPVGTLVEVTGAWGHYRKVDEGTWVSQRTALYDNEEQYRRMANDDFDTRWNDVIIREFPPESSTGPVVGDQVRGREAMMALPVGTVLQYEGGVEVIERTESGIARRGMPDYVYSDGQLNLTGWRVIGVPGAAPEFTVGQEVNPAVALALPVGSAILHQGATMEQGIWFQVIERDDIRRHASDGTIADMRNRASAFTGSGTWRIGRVGPGETVETPTTPLTVGDRMEEGPREGRATWLRRTPMGATVSVPGVGRFVREGEDVWRGSDRVRTTTEMASWVGITVEALATVSSTGPATTATTPPVVQGLDPTRVQHALHEYLTDHSGLSDGEREDVLAMLDDLGLERPEPEKEMVTVSLVLRGTVSDYFDGPLGDYLGVSVDNSGHLTAEWSESVNVDVEVDEGSCACDEVTFDQAQQALRDYGANDAVIEGDWEIDERSCPNC